MVRAIAFSNRRLWISAFLILTLTLTSSCAFRFSKLGDQEAEPDPITLLRRDIRQLRADHRVALFDLQKDLNAQIERVHGELKKEAAEKERDQFALRKRDADFAEQIAEIEMQIRILGGSLEEEVNRVKERSDQNSNEALSALAAFRSALSKKEKQEASADLAMETKIRDELKQEREARKSLQAQMDAMRAFNETLQESSNEQIKALKAVSDRVSELIEKVLPAVNTLGQRVDQHDDQLKAVKADKNGAGIDRKLSDLSKAVDTQRKSLELLGNTLTVQVDKQQKLLQQALDKLQALEEKGARAKK